MKIVQLKSENVKRLSAINIKPDGSTVVIGGRNAQGKSSVLDSIMYALSGTDSLPSQPLRNGTDKGQVTVDLGDYIVTRKFSRKDDEVRSTLEIKNRDGAKVSSPQSILDGLCGKMAFDPLEFSRLKPKAQLEALKELVGLDFTNIDKERTSVFERRTELNRQVKAKAAELAACPKVDAPARELSVAALTDDLQACQNINKANEQKREELSRLDSRVGLLTEKCSSIEKQIAELTRQLGENRTFLSDATSTRDELKKHVLFLEDADCEEVREQLRQAESINRAVRQNQKHEQLEKELESLTTDASSLTDRLTEIDKRKADAMASAPFPVEGLGFDENGVTYKGLPFSQASSAEALRVSLAMGIALNPTLRVMLIRDGSLLDSDSLEMVGQMAEESGSQVWLERVGSADACAVIIEDGAVLEAVEA